MTIDKARILLAHVPCKVAMQLRQQVVANGGLVLLGEHADGQVDEVLDVEGIELELMLEQSTLTFVVVEESQHVIEQATEHYDGGTLAVAHAGKQLIELVNLLRLVGGQQFLGIGDEQDTIFQSTHLLVEVSEELIPVSGVDTCDCLLGNAAGHHFRRHKIGYEVLARS